MKKDIKVHPSSMKIKGKTLTVSFEIPEALRAPSKKETFYVMVPPGRTPNLRISQD